MRYIDGRIVYVDTSRKVCDAISLDGLNYIQDVQYVKNSGLMQSGDIYHPEIGDVVVIEIGIDGESVLVRHYASRSLTGKNLPSFGVGGDISALPGDRNIVGPDGAIMALIRGKTAKIGGGPLAQTIYFGIESLIRTVCMNYEAIGSGFRIFSVNDGGNVITRLCFTSKDQYAVQGFNTNENSSSENFEYQIDITKDGFAIFIGEIDQITLKRKNNFTISITQAGDIIGTCGQNIQFSMYESGAFSYKILDNSHKVLYNKSVALAGEKVLVKELIVGDLIRQITGNVFEVITGTKSSKSDTELTVTNTTDRTSVTNKNSAAINIDDLEPAPSANFRSS